MPQHRNHFYMATVMVSYASDLGSGSTFMNFVLQIPEKKITAETIDTGRTMILQRAITEGLVKDLTQLKDIVFMNWSHLGFMTEEEFTRRDSDEDPTGKLSKKISKANPYDA